MPRINPIDYDIVDIQSTAAVQVVQRKLGSLCHFVSALVHSPAAPARYLRRCGTLGGIAAIALLLAGGFVMDSAAETREVTAPTWTNQGELVLPEDYHHWVFLGSPLTPNALNGGAAGFPEYHNVYIAPVAFRAYRETGDFAEGTVLLKELQLTMPGTDADGSRVEASGRGYFPAARNGIDIAVKDSKRFAATNGWGFFNFGHHAPPYVKTAAAAPTEVCAGCHMANADNMVFRKFYAPILDAK